MSDSQEQFDSPGARRNTMTMPDRARLPHKQRLFVAAYLENGFNATKAAETAGYSKRSAATQGSRMLRNDNIIRALDMELKRRGLTPEDCHCLLKEIATADLADFEPYLSGDKTLTELRAEGINTSVVRSARIDSKGNRYLELCDTVSALDRVMRAIGMLNSAGQKEATEINVIINIPQNDQSADVIDAGLLSAETSEPLSLPTAAESRQD